MPTVGLVTIGQAPRPDITEDIAADLPDKIDIVEAGALDNYETADAVEAELSPNEGDPRFVSTMRDGATVVVHPDAVAEKVQDRIRELSSEVAAVGILCTGAFPHFEASVPVLETGALLRAWGDAIAPTSTLGVLMPKPEQAAQIQAEWSKERDIRIASASPYDDSANVRRAAADLGDVDLVLLKCMGYDYETKQTVTEVTNAGSLLPRSILTKAITEVVPYS
jgi:protein AroM